MVAGLHALSIDAPGSRAYMEAEKKPAICGLFLSGYSRLAPVGDEKGFTSTRLPLICLRYQVPLAGSHLGVTSYSFGSGLC